VRAIFHRDAPDPFNPSLADDLTNPARNVLTAQDLREIVQLSANFQIAPKPWSQLGISFGRWMALLRQFGLLGYRYVPKPIVANQFMLSSAGAWAKLRSDWTSPEEIDPFLPPEALDQVGMPRISLEQYQRRATLGRDQFVRVVRHGLLLPTCHRAVLVTITERQFMPEQIGSELTANGRVAIFGATAYLCQFSYIMVKRPLVRYDEPSETYPSGDREMPLRAIRLLTVETPKLDAFIAGQPFWVRVGGKDLPFNVLAEDAASQPVSFAMPLMFVPYEALGNSALLQAQYAASALRGPARATFPLGNQLVHLARRSAARTQLCPPSRSRSGPTSRPARPDACHLANGCAPSCRLSRAPSCTSRPWSGSRVARIPWL